MSKVNIQTAEPSGSFKNILNIANSNTKIIAEKLRIFIGSLVPGTIEVVWEKQNIAGYGIGPKKMSEQFCYIAPFKKHVNLGFYYGADLEDLFNLLEGSGKNLRHIKIRSKKDISKLEVQKLLEQASKHLPNK
mgnify:CR=1 FL=1